MHLDPNVLWPNIIEGTVLGLFWLGGCAWLVCGLRHAARQIAWAITQTTMREKSPGGCGCQSH